MRFSYDLAGAEPIIRDVPLYDASGIANGELVMLGNTDPDSNADHGVAFQTAYESSQAASAVDALGVCQEDITCTTLPDVATEAASYGKVIVNPFAVYLAEYSQAAADDVALTQAWSTTTLTLTSLEDDIDCGWVLGSSESATSGFAGQLRWISASASGSCTLSTAPTTAGTTNDMIVKILPVNHRLTSLNAGATGLLSQAAAGACVSLHIVENFIEADGLSFSPLRRYNHDGLDLTNARAYAAIVMLDHVYKIGD
ncbi:MAG: hypothetical protein JRI54_11645 [Deltaproteobacteria bacterium]|nr:hypothetical protein [Deltaproteobacteria bacterium]